jgi:alpha-amylase/alpha-mannosidase (GH57 family)
MSYYVCIHGHFYQPPRENPWLEEVELQEGAHPYHDWNEKITAECYAPNTASRILNSERKIVEIVNNYSKISFDFGPTLLLWLERHAPEVYQVIIETDKECQKKYSGHGPAIAQVYNHMIMPLANSRDKRTQVVWGIRDFEHRFGRKPEGMWLPETAVDLETLDIMAEYGIKFTILAPHQASRIRKIGEEKWNNVFGGSINPKMPYLCRLPSGRSISIFFYDQSVSLDVAFGDLLKNGENFALKIVRSFSQAQRQPQIVHIATDGETYGHHLKFGDMALSYCLHYIESRNLAQITVYGEYLEKNPPTYEVEIIENTSWSCFHGIERWRSDCGCRMGAEPEFKQEWRTHLREAMDWLGDRVNLIYEREMAQYIQDPWKARDDYIEVILDRCVENVERFLSKHSKKQLSKEEKVRVLKLLEMQRNALLMYTSCGWFFDEISGIESTQVMKYAARAMQLAREICGVDLEADYLKILEKAPSNIPEYQNGARVYDLFVRPSITDLLRVGAHYAISSIFGEYRETQKIYCYTAKNEAFENLETENKKFAVGRVRLRSDITWEESVVSFAVLHFGDQNLIVGVREFMDRKSFSQMCKETKKTFLKGDFSKVADLINKYFEKQVYSLSQLFRDEQIKILSRILEPTQKKIENLFLQIYKNNYPIIQTLNGMGISLPQTLAAVIELTLNNALRKSLEDEDSNIEELQKLVSEMKKRSIEPDKTDMGFVASKKINKLMERLAQSPQDSSLLETIVKTLNILSVFPLELNLWKAQNIYFSVGKKFCGPMQKKAETDPHAKMWLDHFNELGEFLGVKCV